MLLKAFLRGSKINTISVLGSGWLGLPLIEHLASKGYTVKGSTRTEERLSLISSFGAAPYLLDIATGIPASSSFLSAQTLIINIPYKGVAEFKLLIEAIEGSNIQQVLFVSSSSVYQNSAGDVTEDDLEQLKPCELLSIENMFRENDHFSTTVVRLAGLIGYSRNPANFFRGGKTVQKPEAKVNLIHRDDCINIISKVIEKQAWGKIYNCAADTHPTKREFYTYASTQSNMPIPNFANDNDRAFKVLLNDRVKQELNYQFKHPDLLNLPYSTFQNKKTGV